MSIEEYKAMLADKEKKPAKYKNIKTVVDGITFDSIAESRRYQELKLLERAEEITDIRVHQKISIDINGTHVCNYYPDFVYFNYETGAYIVEDVKSGPTKTSVYRLKKKLMLAVHGIEIIEIE